MYGQEKPQIRCQTPNLVRWGEKVDSVYMQSSRDCLLGVFVIIIFPHTTDGTNQTTIG